MVKNRAGVFQPFTPNQPPAKGRVLSGFARGIHFACDCDVSPMQLLQVGQSGVRRARANRMCQLQTSQALRTRPVYEEYLLSLELSDRSGSRLP